MSGKIKVYIYITQFNYFFLGVCESCLIKDLKDDIRIKLNTDNFELLFNGHKLDDSMQLRHYNIRNGSIMQVVGDTTASKPVLTKVKVQTLTDDVFEVEINEEDSFKNVMAQLRRKAGFPKSYEQIFFADERTCTDEYFEKEMEECYGIAKSINDGVERIVTRNPSKIVPNLDNASNVAADDPEFEDDFSQTSTFNFDNNTYHQYTTSEHVARHTNSSFIPPPRYSEVEELQSMLMPEQSISEVMERLRICHEASRLGSSSSAEQAYFDNSFDHGPMFDDNDNNIRYPDVANTDETEDSVIDVTQPQFTHNGVITLTDSPYSTKSAGFITLGDSPYNAALNYDKEESFQNLVSFDETSFDDKHDDDYDPSETEQSFQSEYEISPEDAVLQFSDGENTDSDLESDVDRKCLPLNSPANRNIFCSCETGCKSRLCKCRKNGLPCNIKCHRRYDCENFLKLNE